jgi:NifB/MoaA-like Fe-S oxidoreductase
MEMSEELRLALESLKDYKMSQSELDAQRLSFVYGNGSSDDNGTKESVERAIDLAEMA